MDLYTLRELSGKAAPTWERHHAESTRICDGAHETEAGCTTVVEAEILYWPRAAALANADFAHACVAYVRALLAE